MQVIELPTNLEVQQGYSGRYLCDAPATSGDGASMCLFLLPRSPAFYPEYVSPMRDLFH